MPRFTVSTAYPPRTQTVHAATHGGALDEYEQAYEAESGFALPATIASVSGKGETRRYVNPEGFWERDDTAHAYAG